MDTDQQTPLVIAKDTVDDELLVDPNPAFSTNNPLEDRSETLLQSKEPHVVCIHSL